MFKTIFVILFQITISKRKKVFLVDFRQNIWKNFFTFFSLCTILQLHHNHCQKNYHGGRHRVAITTLSYIVRKMTIFLITVDQLLWSLSNKMIINRDHPGWSRAVWSEVAARSYSLLLSIHGERTKHDTWCALREKAMEMVILFWGWVEKKRLVGKRLSGSHFPSCRQWRVSDFQINRGSWPGLKWSLICLMTKNCVAVLCHLQNYIQ